MLSVSCSKSAHSLCIFILCPLVISKFQSLEFQQPFPKIWALNSHRHTCRSMSATVASGTLWLSDKWRTGMGMALMDKDGFAYHLVWIWCITHLHHFVFVLSCLSVKLHWLEYCWKNKLRPILSKLKQMQLASKSPFPVVPICLWFWNMESLESPVLPVIWYLWSCALWQKYILCCSVPYRSTTEQC